MSNSPDNPLGAERLSDSLGREVDRVLCEARTTLDLWQTLQRLGPPASGETPIAGMVRNAIRTELARREEEDAAKIYAVVEEALITGDLRPFWAAREAYATTSPELTARLFPHEPDDATDEVPRDPGIPEEAYKTARRIIREQIAAIEDTTPTGSMIEAFAVLKDAIEREEPRRREPLRYALELERRRQARTGRNLLRTRLALTLAPGRSYDQFLTIRSVYADLADEDRKKLFALGQD